MPPAGRLFRARLAIGACVSTLGIGSFLAFASAPAVADDADYSKSDTPLFDYAMAQPSATQPFNEPLRQQIAAVQADISRHPPPTDSECAHTLGASRFARQYDDLGSALSSSGDYDGAVTAFEKALACAPRAPNLHAELASELLHVGRLEEARATARRGLAIDRDNPALDSVLMQLDFIDEHWADVVARLRAMIATQTDDERAAYYQCFLWLAQRRAGVRHPELVARTEYDEWPAPVLARLKGTLTEAQVLEKVREQKNEQRRREVLVEALYYIGQLRLANGEAETARRYFAAAVNLKVLYFIEHHMALAEIAKIRERSAEAPTAAARER